MPAPITPTTSDSTGSSRLLFAAMAWISTQLTLGGRSATGRPAVDAGDRRGDRRVVPRSSNQAEGRDLAPVGRRGAGRRSRPLAQCAAGPVRPDDMPTRCRSCEHGPPTLRPSRSSP